MSSVAEIVTEIGNFCAPLDICMWMFYVYWCACMVRDFIHI